MTKLTQRVEQLEAKVVTEDDAPLYVSFATLAEAEAAAEAGEHGGPRAKGYVGISPDDWPANKEEVSKRP